MARFQLLHTFVESVCGSPDETESKIVVGLAHVTKKVTRLRHVLTTYGTLLLIAENPHPAEIGTALPLFIDADGPKYK